MLSYLICASDILVVCCLNKTRVNHIKIFIYNEKIRNLPKPHFSGRRAVIGEEYH